MIYLDSNFKETKHPNLYCYGIDVKKKEIELFIFKDKKQTVERFQLKEIGFK